MLLFHDLRGILVLRQPSTSSFPVVRFVLRQHVMSKIILHGSVDGRRRKGRPRKSWKDNINDLTGQSMPSLLRVAEDKRR